MGRRKGSREGNFSEAQHWLSSLTTTPGAKGKELRLAVSPLSVFCYCLASSRKTFQSVPRWQEGKTWTILCYMCKQKDLQHLAIHTSPPGFGVWSTILNYSLSDPSGTCCIQVRIYFRQSCKLWPWSTGISILHQTLWEQIPGKLKQKRLLGRKALQYRPTDRRKTGRDSASASLGGTWSVVRKWDMPGGRLILWPCRGWAPSQQQKGHPTLISRSER